MAHLMGDDDPFLFTTDQLEEELNTANNELLLDSHTPTTTADSVPSLQTADSGEESGRPKRKRKPSPKAQLVQEESERQQTTQHPKQSKRRTKTIAIVEPTLSEQPTKTTSRKPPKQRKPPPVKAAASTSTKKRKKTIFKAKYEPLAPQVHPSRGQNRQKTFTWADRMVQLADYKSKFGHVAIPTVRRDPYYNLGLWLAAQRSLHRKNNLKKDRLDELRQLGCVGFGSAKK